MDGVGGESPILEFDDVTLDLVGGEVVQRLGSAPGEVGVELLPVPVERPVATAKDAEVEHPLLGQVDKLVLTRRADLSGGVGGRGAGALVGLQRQATGAVLVTGQRPSSHPFWGFREGQRFVKCPMVLRFLQPSSGSLRPSLEPGRSPRGWS